VVVGFSSELHGSASRADSRGSASRLGDSAKMSASRLSDYEFCISIVNKPT
jgi:hypothetical protein